MSREQWEHSPPQTTLTGQWVNEGEWMTTTKTGVDDDQIDLDRKKVISDQKKKRMRNKPFSHSSSGKKAKVSVEVGTEVSALEETGVSEQLETGRNEELVVDNTSSYDSAFENDKLTSPRKLNSRFAARKDIHINNKATNTTTTTTIPKNRNRESKMVKDLNKHILHQNDVIADLRNKLEMIRDISNDSTTFNSTMLKPIVKKVGESLVQINDETNSGEDITSESCKNVINLHIH